MTEETKRVNIEREPNPERGSDDGVTNDSLGTTDIADSTGLDTDLDTDQPAGADSTSGDESGRKSSANR